MDKIQNFFKIIKNALILIFYWSFVTDSHSIRDAEEKAQKTGVLLRDSVRDAIDESTGSDITNIEKAILFNSVKMGFNSENF
jgi:hypothetical protein